MQVRQDAAHGDAAGEPLPEGATETASEGEPATDTAAGETTLTEDIAALVESGRTYAEAELAFQKTRAAVAGSNAAKAAAALVVALVLLNIAVIALAVGIIIALAPLITIWGAIGVVVGALLLVVALLLRSARQRASVLSSLFSSNEETA